MTREHATLTTDSVAERLRRWTRNPAGSARRGSNPTAVASVSCHPTHPPRPLRRPQPLRPRREEPTCPRTPPTPTHTRPWWEHNGLRQTEGGVGSRGPWGVQSARCAPAFCTPAHPPTHHPWDKEARHFDSRHCGRAVKEMDSKSSGLSPQGFDSHCRRFCLLLTPNPHPPRPLRRPQLLRPRHEEPTCPRTPPTTTHTRPHPAG